MSETPRQKLQRLLYELFQFDSADLDFGIYRIMNLRRDELQRFIDKDLLDAVAMGFEEIKKGESHQILEELAELRKQITQTLEIDVEGEVQAAFRNTPLVKQYLEKKAQLADVKVSEELEAELFSNIYTFFSRYWDEGDFISRRRYSRDPKYAIGIPYNGEEVMLHWANHDQYYIKTGEYFSDYSFKAEAYTIHFKIVAAQTEQNNVKGEKRFFLLHDRDDPTVVSETNNIITIQFRYRPLTEQEQITYGKQKHQEKINDTVCQKILNTVTDQRLKAHLSTVKEGEERSLLAKHLYRYTKKNTSDYFIHKDLKGFLEREFDFFIKNEVMVLDAIGTEKEIHFNKYLTKVRVLKQVCLKIIAFLAQLEDFQKKLFEKRKFVLETNYCITLDNVPEKFYDEILENEDQLNAWKELFVLPIDVKRKLLLPQELDELKAGKRSKKKGQQSLGLKSEAVKLNKAWLKKNLTLVLDTMFLDHDLRDRILSAIPQLDEAVDGLLIKGENFQSISLLLQRYRHSIECVYVDPPYNTAASPIVYKNNYQDSSWLALMYDRLRLCQVFFRGDTHALCVAIDDTELANLSKLLEVVFPDHEIQRVVVNHYPGSGTGRSNVSRTHEYAIFVLPTGSDILRGEEKSAGTRERLFRRSGTGENNYRTGRPNSFFAILVNPTNQKIVGLEPPPAKDQTDYPRKKTKEGWIRIYPIGEDGAERVWSLSYESSQDPLASGKIICSPNMSILRLVEDQEGDRELLESVWLDKKFNAVTYGTNLLGNILGTAGLFSYPKSLYTVTRAIEATTHGMKNATVLDFFGGSGTTAHAVIELNRSKVTHHKYIVVEVADYFDTVLKPRIERVMYSAKWKDGKPIGKEGGRHIFKYQTLESYEDTLNNIELNTGAQSAMFEDYTLRYLLDYESRASASLLNVEKMSKPFDYELDVYEKGERKRKKVDLIETFNYLLGLQVNRIRTYRRTDDEERIYRVVFGSIDGKTIVVVWRNTDGIDLEADKQFIEKEILKDQTFDFLYINGDSFVPNAHPIEKTFKERMFAPVNV
jgi:adenine-specific DNA-methyltransferase